MPHNNNNNTNNKHGAFQPKNPRTIQPFDEDDDDFDDTSLFGSSITTSTKKTSGTQALADFLNTTSPEEFQRPSPQSTMSTSSSTTTTSSSTFFRLRKSKRQTNNNNASSSASTTTTLSTLNDIPSASSMMGKNKKQHLDIVSSRSTSQQQQQQQHPQKPQQPSNFQRPPLHSYHQQSTKQPQSSSEQPVPLQQRSLPRIPTSPTASLSSSHQSLALREPQSPILPNRRRESSLYSGSLRNNASLRGRMSDYGSSSAGRGNTTTNRRNIMELFDQPTTTTTTTQHPAKKPKEIDHIDAALLQRLEQQKSTNDNGSQTLEEPIISTQQTTFSKARRHIQTQTTQTCIITEPLTHDKPLLQRSNNNMTVEQLEKQIAEEKRRQKRLQVAIEQSTDQFEVLSGLAYMKLRELWEERMRWEEAYFTLSERLEEIQHQQQPMTDPTSAAAVAALVASNNAAAHQLPPPPATAQFI